MNLHFAAGYFADNPYFPAHHANCLVQNASISPHFFGKRRPTPPHSNLPPKFTFPTDGHPRRIPNPHPRKKIEPAITRRLLSEGEKGAQSPPI
jgi:hypothetical protein